MVRLRYGEQLAGWRDRHGLTQAQAAALMGVAPNTWARWERDERQAPAPALRLMVTLNQLWTHEPGWWRPGGAS